MEDSVSNDDLLETLKLLATPIDFDKLIADDVLEKSGAWYIVLKREEVPKHVWRQAVGVRFGHGQMKIKFGRPARGARALYEKIASKPMPDDEDLVLEAHARIASEKALIGEEDTREFVE